MAYKIKTKGKTLLLGAGAQHFKYLQSPLGDREFIGLVTLDQFPGPKIDVVHDLNCHPLPFKDEEFDEIHAYEVLEHLGWQGDWRFFFAEWSEYYRILKPGGFFCGSVPAHGSVWVWGDPSHTRAIPVETFIFLDQASYQQIGKSPMSDFRSVWKGNFRLHMAKVEGERLFFSLECIKGASDGNQAKPAKRAGSRNAKPKADRADAKAGRRR